MVLRFGYRKTIDLDIWLEGVHPDDVVVESSTPMALSCPSLRSKDLYDSAWMN